MSSENHVTQDHCYLDDSGSEEIAFKVKVKDAILTSTPVQKCNGQQYVLIKKKNNVYNYYSDNTFVPNVVYIPAVEYCTDHSDLFLHEDEKLVKPGDKFDSHNDFIQYLNENAKRWYFYYKCSDSRKPNTESETYVYTCVYLRNKEKYIKKGIRKRTNNIKTNCPCKIKLKHLPNEKQLTVVFVCNHHDHPLSEQEFYKLQHGRRLPPYIKEEIMDLISLQVEMDKIKKYVQMQTGFNMNRTFFYQIERTMRLRNLERRISDERLLYLSVKISMVDESCCEEDNNMNEKCIQENIESSKGLKSNNNKTNKVCNLNENSTNDNLNVQDVIVVQESLNCETQSNPWIVLPDRTSFNSLDSEITKYKDLIDIASLGSHSHIDNVNEENTYYTVNRNYDQLTVSEANESREDGLDYNYVAYETVVTDTVEDNYTQLVEHANYERSNETSHKNVEVTKDNHRKPECEAQKSLEDDSKEIEKKSSDNNIEFTGFIHFKSDMNEDVHFCENVKDPNDEKTIECDIESTLDSSTSCKVEVQSRDEIKTARYPLVPVFDVYMKEGNVTGFVVNDDVLNNLKQVGIEKGVQTNKRDKCVTQISNAFEKNAHAEQNAPESYIEQISQNTYQKHEYIHKYNIDQYMVQPHFPNYISKLSQEIHIETWQMIKNVYSEKAMFKMTTTQRGKEGDTRIWYLKIQFE